MTRLFAWIRDALLWVSLGPILLLVLLSPLLYAGMMGLHAWVIYTPGGSFWVSVFTILFLLAMSPFMLRVWWRFVSVVILNRPDARRSSATR